MIRIVAKQKAEYERNNRSLKIRLYSFVALFITCLLIGSIWFQKTSNLNFSFLELKNPISTAQRQHVKNKNRLPPGIDFLKKGAPKK